MSTGVSDARRMLETHLTAFAEAHRGYLCFYHETADELHRIASTEEEKLICSAMLLAAAVLMHDDLCRAEMAQGEQR